jgi:hypothetical protein
MPQAPTTRDAIVALLKDVGPMTAAEIASMLEKNIKTVQSCIATARNTKKRFFYIQGYEFTPGSNGVPAIYAAGRKPDAERVDRGATQHLYYERTKHLRKLLNSPRVGHFDVLIAQVTSK